MVDSAWVGTGQSDGKRRSTKLALRCRTAVEDFRRATFNTEWVVNQIGGREALQSSANGAIASGVGTRAFQNEESCAVAQICGRHR